MSLMRSTAPEWGATLTAGELVDALSAVDRDRPVTILWPGGEWWYNISKVDPCPDEPSVMLLTTNDFDTRQF